MLKTKSINRRQLPRALSFVAVLLVPVASFAAQPLATGNVDILGVTVRVFTADPNDALIRPRNVRTFLETEIVDAAGTEVSADPVFDGYNGAKGEVRMVGHQGPGVDSGVGADDQRAETVEEVSAVTIRAEDLAAFDAADDHVVKGAR